MEGSPSMIIRVHFDGETKQLDVQQTDPIFAAIAEAWGYAPDAVQCRRRSSVGGRLL